MATFPGTYIQIEQHTSARVNYIVDNILNPSIGSFREVTIYDEQSVLLPDNKTWKNTYRSWNPDFPLIIRYNGKEIDVPTTIDYKRGTFILDYTLSLGDNVYTTYNFDYFPVEILYGFMLQVVDTINTGAYGTASEYTLENAPIIWNGVIADLTCARCMEKLILDYDLWKGKLIFAVDFMDNASGGDIVGQLETLKQNFEERAYKTMDNEKFKNPPYASPPTSIYYDAIRGGGMGGMFNDKGVGVGRYRGMRINKWY